MTDTVTNEPLPSLDPAALLAGDLTPTKLDNFKAAVFHTVDSLEQLRDWLQTPKAKGTARGVALWALGRHEEAIPLLSGDKSNAVVALCLASSLAALGQIEEAGKLLSRRETDAARLRRGERIRSGHRIRGGTRIRGGNFGGKRIRGERIRGGKRGKRIEAN